MSIRDYPLVLVEWIDSMGASGEWGDAENLLEEPEHIVVRSVGWLLVDGERYKVVLPHTHDADKKNNIMWGGAGDIKIPTVAVLSITNLRKGKTREARTTRTQPNAGEDDARPSSHEAEVVDQQPVEITHGTP